MAPLTTSASMLIAARALLLAAAAQEPSAATSTLEPGDPPATRAPRGVWYEGPRPDDPQFTVVNGREGAAALWTLELIGSGVGMIDYDRDGDLDLYVVVGKLPGDPSDDSTDRLLRNRGDGTFEDVTDAAGVRESSWGFGVAVGDYDGDGFDDLFVANWGADRLLRNRGDGTFEDVTAAAGVADDGWSTSAAFGDPDGDGDLDLYVCRYFKHDPVRPPHDGKPCNFLDLLVPCGPQWLPAERDLFGRNDRDPADAKKPAKFTEVSRAAGMQEIRPSYGLGTTFCDVDADGLLDLFVGNDSLPNFVFRNRGGLKFEDVGAVSGLSVSINGREQACMGVDVADFDGDGREDFVVTNFSADYNTIYRDQGDGFFDDVTQLVGLGDVAWWTLGWGVRFFDADCDGDLDLFVANGHVYPTIDGRSSMTYAQLDHLYLQQGGRFELVSSEAGPGLQRIEPSRGAAFGDLDGDGWIDVVVSARNRPLSILRARPQPGVHRLLVELVPGNDLRPVDHALVRARTGGRTQLRRVNRGGSYCSSNDPRVHFGLGDAAVVEQLEITWPGGEKQVLQDVPADVLLRVERGGEIRTEPLR